MRIIILQTWSITCPPAIWSRCQPTLVPTSMVQNEEADKRPSLAIITHHEAQFIGSHNSPTSAIQAHVSSFSQVFSSSAPKLPPRSVLSSIPPSWTGECALRIWIARFVQMLVYTEYLVGAWTFANHFCQGNYALDWRCKLFWELVWCGFFTVCALGAK